MEYNDEFKKQIENLNKMLNLQDELCELKKYIVLLNSALKLCDYNLETGCGHNYDYLRWVNFFDEAHKQKYISILKNSCEEIFSTSRNNYIKEKALQKLTKEEKLALGILNPEVRELNGN